MLKIIGLILVVAAFTGVGFFRAEALRYRHLRLREICLFIEETADRIRTGEELYHIIDLCGQKAGIFVEDYHTRIDRKGLTAEDIRLAEGFFSELGMGDTESQLKRCEVYLQMLRKNEAEACVEAHTKTSLYGKLGFFAGLFAAIILI